MYGRVTVTPLNKCVYVRFFNFKYDVYIKSNNLERVKDKENKVMDKLEGYYAVATIKHGIYDKIYHYAIYDDGNIYVAGDKVLVSGCHSNQPCVISEILTLDEAKERSSKSITAEIICKCDTSSYDKRVEERKEKAERKKEADKIKKQMDKMITEMDQTKRYEMYANDNPELAEKLKVYKELIEE